MSYKSLKNRVFSMACACTGSHNHAAESAGYVDVFDLLISDRDHPRVKYFLQQLVDEAALSDNQRKKLLDGLVNEYQQMTNWADFYDDDPRAE